MKSTKKTFPSKMGVLMSPKNYPYAMESEVQKLHGKAHDPALTLSLKSVLPYFPIFVIITGTLHAES